MRNIYETGSDGHDFFPARDICREKPTHEFVLNFCENNLCIALENRIDVAKDSGDIQTTNMLTKQLNLWYDDARYKERQCNLATDYIMNSYDWSYLFEEEQHNEHE